MRTRLLIVLVGLGLTAIVQNAWYLNRLPDRVAIHFGADGQPDSWLDKFPASLMMLALQIGLPWMLNGIARLTESCQSR